MIPFNDSKLRRRPDRGGQDGSAAIYTRLLDEIRRNAIVSVGPGLRLVGRPNGRHIALAKFPKVASQSNLASLNPWQIFQWTPAAPADSSPPTYWRNVRVHRGMLNRGTTTASTYIHEMDPNLPVGSNAGSDYDILVPENTTGYKVYLHAEYTTVPFSLTGDGGIKITSVAIKHGTDWWSGHPGLFPSAGNFYHEIGTVTTGDDEDVPTALTINQILTTDLAIDIAPILFVTLSQTGGSEGDKDTPCSFSYEATDLAGNILADGLKPQNSRARIVNAPTNAATLGTVYWDASGEVQLWDCNETVDQYSC